MTSVDSSGLRRAPMSQRRQQVARLVAGALLNKQIAAELGISVGQVKRLIGEIAEAWNLERDKSVRVQIANRYKETNGA